MSLVKAIQENDNKTTTLNGAVAYKSTLDATLDFFSSVGGLRGRDQQALSLFTKAFAEDQDRAIRTLLWTRDVRGGAGERSIFRTIYKYLAKQDYALAEKLIAKTVELGRWDDVLSLVGTPAQKAAFEAIRVALEAGDGLCAKWMPRKGEVAVVLRKHLGYTPKFYRKRLVELTNVVETAMCAKNWEAIDYSKLPSLASARYQKAFCRNDNARYVEYLNALQKGEAKINAGAVYPYDIVKSIRFGNSDVADQQWKALPDFVEDGSFLCLVDVSGSMGCSAGGSNSLSCMDVAVSLGLYLSERCKGVFKDAFITFESNPRLIVTKGSLKQRVHQTMSAPWGGSTDVNKAIALILESAVKSNLPAEDMPKALIVLSDMQFNSYGNKTNYEGMRDQFEKAGYDMPKVIWWNLNDYGNKPVTFNQSGTALVSGFSPALMKSILKGEMITPVQVMDNVIMDDRYAWQ